MTAQERKHKILVVDDDKSTRDGLEKALHGTYEVFLAESAEHALTILNKTDIDVLLTDVRMPGMDGLTLVRRAMAHNPQLICILLTAYGNVDMAVEAMKLGACDFLMKPINLSHLDILIQRALRMRDIESENVTLKTQLDDKYGLENIIGNSQKMREQFEIIRQTAPTQANVLIIGESGTGKELVAIAIHRLSTRSHGRFVPVHCAALAPSLLESELFGHEKGAFTGAVSLKHGRFELADGGTLFLDEVSEIDPSIQVKLLRVIEERKIERVGGTEPIKVDIRLIAATNKNLRQLVEQGKFRDDLFFRLDVVTINLPPLRERTDDIPLLCAHFIKEFNQKNNKSIEEISPEVIEFFSRYPWPGNVRELKNTIEKMVVLARSNRLTVKDIPKNIYNHPDVISNTTKQGVSIPYQTGSKLAETEKQLIISALEKYNGNKAKAAQDLGISRRTIYRKLKQYNIQHKTN